MQWSWLTLLGPVALGEALLLVGILHQQTEGYVCQEASSLSGQLEIVSHLIPVHIELCLAVLK